MTEEEYQAGLAALRRDWGSLAAERGVLRSTADPTTGFIVGLRAPLIAEIINRAIRQSGQSRDGGHGDDR